MGACLGKTAPARRTSVTGSKVVAGLLAKQKQFESTDALKKQMNFDKILLKFPRIQKVLKKTGKLFDSMDADKNGSLDVEELCEAMTELNVSMSKEEVADLFKHSDMEENAKMNKREFLVCLSTGYLLGVIPAFNNVEDSAAPAAKPKTSAVSPEPQDESMNTIMQEGAKEIMDVLDLITMSYLLFDTKAKGFISKKELNAIIAEEGKGSGTSAFLSKERWAEMDWDHNGTISFEEFVFAFYAWVDDGEEDEDV